MARERTAKITKIGREEVMTSHRKGLWVTEHYDRNYQLVKQLVDRYAVGARANHMILVDDVTRAQENDRKTLEALAQYAEAQKNRTPEQKAEEMFEMRAAFGPNTQVVNVITGQVYNL